MAYFVGIDIGGTFTEAVLLDDSGTARLLKTDDIEDGVQYLAHGMGSGTAADLRGGQVLLKAGPLGVGEVGRVRASANRRLLMACDGVGSPSGSEPRLLGRACARR